MTDCTIIYYLKQKHKHNLLLFRERKAAARLFSAGRMEKQHEFTVFLFALPVYK